MRAAEDNLMFGQNKIMQSQLHEYLDFKWNSSLAYLFIIIIFTFSKHMVVHWSYKKDFFFSNSNSHHQVDHYF